MVVYLDDTGVLAGCWGHVGGENDGVVEKGNEIQSTGHLSLWVQAVLYGGIYTLQMVNVENNN
jgi:hypothetical protein